MAAQFKVKLHKIASTHNNLRTDVIEGTTSQLPTLDRHFLMSGSGLEFGTRMLHTTAVTALARVGNTILFSTKNSTYTLLILDEFDDEADDSLSTSSTEA